ncbi:choice-of-anchor I family protein [Roseofilum sp. BLCC_M154]|uniref:Choice-of-anchor I family protein n=1 Tax=Roseofilum acuticapitatum BLCC-M154 TaxID=3022444 RepID=A0ABT7AWG7_9CYAN|nr:choice-of-anchor I family protein [Roseofilum acuticapitatum]MDJ1170917.1 choice-of-anchor I family protein [Roseofilum acuticapitatum BLCC-M154]
MAIELKEIGRYSSGVIDESAAEIVAHDPGTQRLFVVNAQKAAVDVLNISDPRTPTLLSTLNVNTIGAAANSVAVANGVVAVAVENADKVNPGAVAFFDPNGNFLKSVTVGALPDMVTFTPDGRKVLVANEGEPGNTDPEGSISIIDISGGVASATVQTAAFTAFNGQEANLRNQGVRIFPNKTVAEDMEPEYIAVSPDGSTAFVTLQENNAIAKVNIASATVESILPLGLKDHSLSGNRLDASDRDNKINLQNWPVFGMYMPDSIASFVANGQTYYVTANEGDDRGEDKRIKDLTLDPTAFPNAAELQKDEQIGRLGVSTVDGDTDNDGDTDRLFAYGARSFSIWNSSGTLIYDSGDDFGRITAEQVPTLFNSESELDNGNIVTTFDARSDNKGAEPEAIATGVIDGKSYAFIGLERIGGIMVYDVSNPTAPSFVQYIKPNGIDIAPEGLEFIPAADSPNKTPLLAVGNEFSGTTTLYEITQVPPPNLPAPAPAPSPSGEPTAPPSSTPSPTPTPSTGIVVEVAGQFQGTMGNDIFAGTASSNVIFGLDGNDQINAGAGDDTTNGNRGDDTVNGGTGNDMCNGGQGDDQVNCGDGNDRGEGDRGNDIVNGDAGQDQLTGGEGNDAIDGGVDNDAIFGGQGNDLINGGTGDDVISGDFGIDTLIGGAGNDLFVLRTSTAATTAAQADVILDYRPGDTIGLAGGITPNDLTFRVDNGNTIIQVTRNGVTSILGVVNGVAPTQLTFATASIQVNRAGYISVTSNLFVGGSISGQELAVGATAFASVDFTNSLTLV